MKKNIQLQQDLLAKFQGSEVAALGTIAGGTQEPVKTNTNQYLTESSADDADTGDHDKDADAAA